MFSFFCVIVHIFWCVQFLTLSLSIYFAVDYQFSHSVNFWVCAVFDGSLWVLLGVGMEMSMTKGLKRVCSGVGRDEYCLRSKAWQGQNSGLTGATLVSASHSTRLGEGCPVLGREVRQMLGDTISSLVFPPLDTPGLISTSTSM